MSDIQKSTPSHPVVQLLYLLCFAVLGGLFFSIIGMVLYLLFFGNGTLLGMLRNVDTFTDINFLRIFQISSSIGIFIFGPLAFAKVEKCNIKKYYAFNIQKNISALLGLVFLLMLFSTPLLELMAALNQKMVLPEMLKGLENWMRAKEKEAEVVTKQLLLMKTYGQLAINLLMIAIIPAIGEELLFRGAMQRIFVRWFHNPHMAIWFTAIVFSAIHVQFFGFFPRMFLGALFGYLMFWGKSIWLAMFAHFINNGSAVIMAFIWQQQGKSLDNLEATDTFNWPMYLMSIIITLFLLQLYYKQSKQSNINSIYE